MFGLKILVGTLSFDKNGLIRLSVMQGKDIHGVAGLVNLFGIESPGLTSTFAIAEHVANRFL